MAGIRQAYKLKEYRLHVTNVRQWLKEIDFEGLLVTEVYSSAFGPCQVMLPTINQIMLGYDDAEEKIKWLVINVAKLEEEQREYLQNEEKKKQEMASVLRRRSVVASADDAAQAAQQAQAAQTAPVAEQQDAHVLHDDEERRETWDKVTIPKLEPYSGYDSPRPLWLLMKDGEILHELRTANPPKLAKLINSVITGVPIDEKELWAMDHPQHLKRKKGDDKKKHLDDKSVGDDKGEEEVTKDKVILSFQCNNVERDPNKKGGPLLAVYEKNPLTEEFKYVGRTERAHNDPNPLFYKTFWLEKPKNDKEYKVCLYDVDDDKARELKPADLLGEFVLNFRELTEEKKMKFRFVDKEGRELPKVSCWAMAKEPVDPGQASRFSLHISVRGLPDPNMTSWVVLYLQDLNIPKFGAVAQTEQLKTLPPEYMSGAGRGRAGGPGGIGTPGFGDVGGTGMPVTVGRITIDQYSLNDRQLRFGVYDAANFDASLAWAGVGLQEPEQDKSLLGFVQLPLSKLLELQSQTQDGQVTLNLVDKDDVPAGKAELVIRAQEVAIPKERKHGADDGKPKVEVAVAVRELHKRDWNAKSAPVAALYRKNAEQKYDFVACTERIKEDRDPQFWRTFLVDKPTQEGEYKVVIVDVEDDGYSQSRDIGVGSGKEPRGEVLAEAVFDVFPLLDWRTHEVRPADEEGLFLDKTMIALTAKDVGLVKRVEIAVSCRNLPTSGLAAKVSPDPLVVIYASNSITRRWSRVPLAMSERIGGVRHPRFKQTMRVESFSNADRELRIAVYDVNEGEETSWSEKDCIGEAFISLNQFLAARAPQIEYKLMVRGEESLQANEGRAVVRLLTEKDTSEPLRPFEEPIELVLESEDVEEEEWDDLKPKAAVPLIKTQQADPVLLEAPVAGDKGPVTQLALAVAVRLDAESTAADTGSLAIVALYARDVNSEDFVFQAQSEPVPREGELTQWERWMEVEHYGAMDRELRFDVYHVQEDARLSANNMVAQAGCFLSDLLKSLEARRARGEGDGRFIEVPIALAGAARGEVIVRFPASSSSSSSSSATKASSRPPSARREASQPQSQAQSSQPSQPAQASKVPSRPASRTGTASRPASASRSGTAAAAPVSAAGPASESASTATATQEAQPASQPRTEAPAPAPADQAAATSTSTTAADAQAPAATAAPASARGAPSVQPEAKADAPPTATSPDSTPSAAAPSSGTGSATAHASAGTAAAAPAEAGHSHGQEAATAYTTFAAASESIGIAPAVPAAGDSDIPAGAAAGSNAAVSSSITGANKSADHHEPGHHHPHRRPSASSKAGSRPGSAAQMRSRAATPDPSDKKDAEKPKPVEEESNGSS